VNNDFVPEKPLTCTLVRVADAYQAFASLLQLYSKQMEIKRVGIDPQVFIDPSATIGDKPYIGSFAYISSKAKIGDNVQIYPQVYIGDNVTIGDNCILFAGVKVYHNCILGNDCIIHSGTVIGSDGFGFAPQGDSNYQKIPQLGNVVIGNNVEIGSNTSIDRATMGSTIIADGVKLDNLIQVAHNVEIGSNTVMAAQCGIAGSSKIGRNCVIGAQVGIAGHLTIADDVKIGAKSGILSSVKEEGKMLQGAPAVGMTDFFKSFAVYKKLPEMQRLLAALEREIKSMKDTPDSEK
jgi:UDP-3-O-[3-hydroxymyristoyl] glucosamine N-acyltransferase